MIGLIALLIVAVLGIFVFWLLNTGWDLAQRMEAVERRLADLESKRK